MKRITLLAFSLLVAFITSAQVKVEKLWESSTKKGNLVEVKDVRNGFDYYDGELYLASRRAADTDIVIYNAETGLVKETGGAVNKLPDSPISMAWAGGDVAIDNNGAIYCVANNNASIIKWADKTATPTTFATLPATGVWGMDVFVDKDGNGCFVGGVTATSTIYYIPITNNVAGNVKTLTTKIALGNVPRAHIVDSKTFWIDGTSILPTLITLDDSNNIATETAVKTDILSSGVNGITQFTFNNKTYIVAAANNHAAGTIPQHSAAIFEINLADLSLKQIGGYIPELGLGGTTDGSHFVKPIVNVTKDAAFIYLMGGMDGIACFKFTEEAPAKQDPTASFAESTITKKIGDAAFTNAFTTNSDGAKTYKSSNEAVATIDANGQVTILAVGTTTITATTAATNAYNEKEVSYTLIVEAAPVIVPGEVINGSFEIGEVGKMPTGWTDDQKPGFQIKNQTGVAHTGSNYIECTGTNCRLMQKVPVEIGKTYEFSFWYSNYTATNTNGLKNYSLIANGLTPPNYMDIDAGTAPKKLDKATGWTKYTKRFTATAVEMIINVRAYEMCRIDDIALKEVQPAVKPSFSYATTAIEKFTDDAKFTNILTSTTDGIITYESSTPTVATIDNKGEVTIVGIGTTTITAKATLTDNFLAAEATYDLTVKAALTTKVEKLWELSEAKSSKPSWITTDNQRAMDIYGDNLYITSINSSGNHTIIKLDIANGDKAKDLDSGKTGWGGIGGVAISSKGTLLVSRGLSTSFFINKVDINNGGIIGEADGAGFLPSNDYGVGRIDNFNIYGDIEGKGGYISFGGCALTNGKHLIKIIPVVEGKVKTSEAKDIIVPNSKEATISSCSTLPRDNDHVWVGGKSLIPRLVNINDGTAEEFGDIKPSGIANGMAEFTFKNKKYFVASENQLGSIGIYDITEGIDKATKALRNNTENLGTTAGSTYTCPIAIKKEADCIKIFVLSSSNGIIAYKFTDSTPVIKTNPTFEFENEAIAKTIEDKPFTNALNQNTDGIVSYVSSDTNVATVDAFGTVTIVGKGKSTITANVPETDIYNAATASYELTVELLTPSFSFATTAITKKATDEAFTNELTSDTDGTVTYESSNTAIATVDAAGQVTIMKPGEVTITAKAAASDKYAAATANYTLTITLETPTFAYATDKIEKHADDAAFTNELTTNTDGTITYESSNTDVATVNANGEVKILKAGETVITAKSTAGNKYAAATASYDLKVLPPVGINEVRTMAQITNTANGVHIAFEGKALIEIYSVNGSLIEKAEAYEGHDAVLNSGIYIIKVNGTTYKTVK